MVCQAAACEVVLVIVIRACSLAAWCYVVTSFVQGCARRRLGNWRRRRHVAILDDHPDSLLGRVQGVAEDPHTLRRIEHTARVEQRVRAVVDLEARCALRQHGDYEIPDRSHLSRTNIVAASFTATHRRDAHALVRSAHEDQVVRAAQLEVQHVGSHGRVSQHDASVVSGGYPVPAAAMMLHDERCGWRRRRRGE